MDGRVGTPHTFPAVAIGGFGVRGSGRDAGSLRAAKVAVRLTAKPHEIQRDQRAEELLDVWPDPWTVLGESQRAQWDYVPLERVGPLRFGMTPQEAIAAMEAGGFASEGVSKVGEFGPFEQVSTRFRAAGALPYQAAVVAYYVGAMGLTCAAVDALSGPQATMDGIRLIGRPPSELSNDLAAYLEQTGRPIQITTEGGVGSQELGMNPRAQRAGDVLLTRLVFGRPNDWANTVFDCIPAEEWRVH